MWTPENSLKSNVVEYKVAWEKKYLKWQNEKWYNKHKENADESHQHVSIVHVEVEEEEEGDEEAEEGEHGAFPEAPHLLHGLPHEPQDLCRKSDINRKAGHLKFYNSTVTQ